MSTSVKWFITVVIALFVTRTGYRLLDFKPDHDLALIPGLALDLGIWLVVCLATYWTLGKAFPRKTTPGSA